MPEYPSCVRLTFLYSSWRKIKFTALRIWDCNSLQGGGDAPNSSSLLFSLFPPQFVFVVGKSWNILTLYIFRLILDGLVETLKWYAETECRVIVMMVTTLGSCEWDSGLCSWWYLWWWNLSDHVSDALDCAAQSYHESLPCQQRTSISGGIISYLWSRLSYSNIF